MTSSSNNSSSFLSSRTEIRQEWFSHNAHFVHGHISKIIFKTIGITMCNINSTCYPVIGSIYIGNVILLIPLHQEPTRGISISIAGVYQYLGSSKEGSFCFSYERFILFLIRKAVKNSMPHCRVHDHSPRCMHGDSYVHENP